MRGDLTCLGMGGRHYLLIYKLQCDKTSWSVFMVSLLLPVNAFPYEFDCNSLTHANIYTQVRLIFVRQAKAVILAIGVIKCAFHQPLLRFSIGGYHRSR